MALYQAKKKGNNLFVGFISDNKFFCFDAVPQELNFKNDLWMSVADCNPVLQNTIL